MDLLLLFIGFCVFFIPSVISQEDSTIIELTDDTPIQVWNATSSETIQVHAELGYQIQIDVLELDVDGENDNSVTVKRVTDDDADADELMFTYTVSEEPSYLYNTNKVQVDYVGTNDTNSFLLQFTRIGEPLTTTTFVSTTSTESMPTAPAQEDATLTVYLYGRPAGSFGEAELQSLRTAIAKMGTEYCEVQNCPLNGTITWRNVQIKMLKICSVMWEDYDACVLLTFALPIVKLEEREDNPLWEGYQLNESHLKILWDAYGSKYLGQIGLSLYSVPDLNKIVKYRIIIISVVIVVLIILVLSGRHLAGKIGKKSFRRKLSDTVHIVDRSSDRISQQSLPPHYLQELPSHFAREQRNHTTNYSEYNMAYVEDDDKLMPQSISNQLTLSSNTNDLEDAQA